ncbi:MAG: hypothetical protein HDR74_05190 [Bacteroides sp.]|nr:hypothetical protein [Bacteroides sp.]
MANNPNILQTLEAEKEKLFQYASYRLPDIRDVEDVVQNLYLKALSDKNLSNNISNLKAYFYRMLSNECNDILREKSKLPTLWRFRSQPLKQDLDMELKNNFNRNQY